MREALGAQLGVVGLARWRQLGQWHHTHDLAVVAQVDIVARVALSVMDLAGTFRAIQHAAHDSDLCRDLGRADEGRHVVGSFSMAMPLIHSWPVAPHAKQSFAATLSVSAGIASALLKFI